MIRLSTKRPRPGSVDWAAQEILRILDREEAEAAELSRLQQEGRQPPHPPQSRIADDRPMLGDGRDAAIDRIQSDLDRRQALLREARRPTELTDDGIAGPRTTSRAGGWVDGGLLADDPALDPDDRTTEPDWSMVRQPLHGLWAAPAPARAGTAAMGRPPVPGLHRVAGGANAARPMPQLPMSFWQFLDPRHPFGAGIGIAAFPTTARAIQHWLKIRDRQDVPPPEPPRDFEPVDDGAGRAETIPTLSDDGKAPPYPADADAPPPLIVFPDHSELGAGIYVLHSPWGRRGNPMTREHLKKVQEEFLRQHPGAIHLSGGTEKEWAIPGPGVVWESLPDGKRGDGRPGQRFPDLLFWVRDDLLVAINTVDVDRNGQITQAELDAAEALRRAGLQVYLIKKPHQLKNNN